MLNAIGAHIYAGGFTVGVREHFNVLAHLEHAAYGSEVVKLNFPDLPIYAGGPENWPTSWPKGAARPRFLYANPPCAIWSGASAGRACRWQDDPRLQFHHDIFGYALDTVGVDVLAMESVVPVFTKGREHVDELTNVASKSGYSTTVVLHDAQWLGVPQTRKRCFLVFHKIEITWTHPPFGEPMTVRKAFQKLKLRKPIYKLDLSENSWGGGAKETTRKNWVNIALAAGPGERLAAVFDRLNPNPILGNRGQILGRPGFIYARAPWDKPCGVVMQGSLLHPDEPRVLHQDELAAICSFPKSWRWPSGVDYSAVSGYMSRGVMPPVGAWLAENVARALEKNKRLNSTGAYVLDVARPPGRYYEL